MTDAVEKLVSIGFTKDNQFDATLLYVYSQGRKDAFKSLLTYDQDQQANLKEEA